MKLKIFIYKFIYKIFKIICTIMRKNYHIVQQNTPKIRINKIYLKSDIENYSWKDKSKL